MKTAMLATLFGAFVALLPTSSDASDRHTYGRAAYSHAWKALPSGYHDFVPIRGFMHEGPITDAFCSQWEKVISVHRRVFERASADPHVGIESHLMNAVRAVNVANGSEVCWFGTANVASTHIARRGYTDGRGILRPVVILQLVTHDGRRRFYGGYHEQLPHE